MDDSHKDGGRNSRSHPSLSLTHFHPVLQMPFTPGSKQLFVPLLHRLLSQKKVSSNYK